jgi:ABC-type Zn uptake system ZnuABC Zn-binding protein ZnuA
MTGIKNIIMEKLIMKKNNLLKSGILICAITGMFLFASQNVFAKQNKKLFVVATLTDYASIAKEIGGDKIIADAIAKGDEDPHFVRPKPSFAQKLSRADLFISTGLDLELWAPGIVDKSQNASIRDGQPGYVAASSGIKLLEIPAVVDRSSGGVHIYGNPHIHTDPLNAKIIASNIAIGLKKIDPDNGSYYEARLKEFKNKIDNSMFGKELVQILGGKTLTRLAQSGNLISFLKGKEFNGLSLFTLLGGWMKTMQPLYGKQLVTYHKNWIYFARVFGINVVGEVEPKPAIPPSPGDVKRLVETMKKLKIKAVFAANYYDENKVKKICRSVNARPVIVPFSVNGIQKVDNYFKLIDYWTAQLVKAYTK